MSKYLRTITTSLYYRNIFKKCKSDISELISLLADQKSKDTLKYMHMNRKIFLRRNVA